MSQRTVETYGLTVPGSPTQADIELMLAFNPRLQSASGFLGRYQHLRNAIDLLWNLPRRQTALQRGMKDYDQRIHDAYIWNDWSELMISAFAEWNWATTVWGPNASWKTTSAAVYALAAFFASPADTIVVATSTTLSGLKKRLWRELTKYHRACPAFGTPSNSDFAIRFIKGSDEAGIFGFATGQNEGDVQKAVDKIIGFHATNVIAVVDEMQATNEAIVKACASLEAGVQKFQLIGLGNPDSELDALGLMSEPSDGWNTISVEDERWTTKRGICIHLDGLESPRVKDGEQYYPGLLTAANIESVRKSDGEDSPEFWRTRRGFLAPQGVRKTILSPIEIRNFHAEEAATWVSDYKMGAGFDPAFEGGDRPILQIGKVGRIVIGPNEERMAIELGETLTLKVEATSTEPIHYQLARQVKEICQQRGIEPAMFAMDSTGEGDGVASILRREWSDAITRVEFGGAASTRPIGGEESEPANKKYLYRVTELWYGFRNLVRNGQIRGLPKPTALEFCQRLYKMVGNLRQVEPKAEMKSRTKRSPDLADATVVLCELFRQREKIGVETSPHALSSMTQWRELARTYSVASDYLVGA